MKILAIGNSFSQDATRYLHQIAQADDADCKVVNLYIGGCPLRRHYINILEDRRAYALEFNGENTGFSVSVKEALISDDWDAVTMQQVSNLAPDYDTYQPYLNTLSTHVRKYAPKAKLYLHQTWAYEQGSKRLREELHYRDYQDMLRDLTDAYQKAADEIQADGIIPSGQLFDRLLRSGIPKVHRDTFHASLGLGRYALGLLWYAVLLGKDVCENTFAAFDEPISAEEIHIVKQTVSALVNAKPNQA